MSDDKLGQCAHGYYGLCPHCYESLRAELAELRAREKEVPRTTEWHIAMREANQIHDADAYFAARSEMLDSGHNRHLFEAGYQRGFDAGEKVYAGTAAAAVPEAVAKDAAGIWMREFVDAVEHEAFNMRAPNTHTPVLVGMCIEARRRLLAAKIDASKGEESEFQVISGADEDACIEAATSGPRDMALREAMRYAHQYAEDGPVKVVELVTVAMLAASGRQENTNPHTRDLVLAQDAKRGNFRALKKDEPNG